MSAGMKKPIEACREWKQHYVAEFNRAANEFDETILEKGVFRIFPAKSYLGSMSILFDT